MSPHDLAWLSAVSGSDERRPDQPASHRGHGARPERRAAFRLLFEACVINPGTQLLLVVVTMFLVQVVTARTWQSQGVLPLVILLSCFVSSVVVGMLTSNRHRLSSLATMGLLLLGQLFAFNVLIVAATVSLGYGGMLLPILLLGSAELWLWVVGTAIGGMVGGYISAYSGGSRELRDA
jgi:hypothetical protein